MFLRVLALARVGDLRFLNKVLIFGVAGVSPVVPFFRGFLFLLLVTSPWPSWAPPAAVLTGLFPSSGSTDSTGGGKRKFGGSGFCFCSIP